MDQFEFRTYLLEEAGRRFLKLRFEIRLHMKLIDAMLGGQTYITLGDVLLDTRAQRDQELAMVELELECVENALEELHDELAAQHLTRFLAPSAIHA